MKKPPEVRNPYNYDADALSDKTGLACHDESLTSQEYVEEADINYIAERFMRTGLMPQVLNMPTFGDFQGTADFQQSLNLINTAKAEFMTLPARIRSRFDNDPQKLIEFLDDPANYDEAEQLGLIDKEKANARRSQRSAEKPPQATTRKDGTPTTQGQDAPTQKPGPETASADRTGA